MLLAFAEKTISGLVFSALMVGIATYIGQPLIFDPLVLLAYIAIAVVFRRNIDLLSICSIFIAVRGLEELMFRFLGNTIWFKVPCYLIFLIIPFFWASGMLKHFMVAFVTVGIGIEIYWYITDYNAPWVYWYFYLLTIAIIVRKFLRMRVFWLLEINTDLEPKPLPLDSQLLIANGVFIALNILMIGEYWLRHLTDMSDLLLIYNINAYVAHIMSIFIIYMLVVQSVHHLKALELNA